MLFDNHIFKGFLYSLLEISNNEYVTSYQAKDVYSVKM